MGPSVFHDILPLKYFTLSRLEPDNVPLRRECYALPGDTMSSTDMPN